MIDMFETKAVVVPVRTSESTRLCNAELELSLPDIPLQGHWDIVNGQEERNSCEMHRDVRTYSTCRTSYALSIYVLFITQRSVFLKKFIHIVKVESSSPSSD